MAGGGRGRRTYARDGRGRFASTGTSTAKAKPAARRAQRGTNRLTRDNSGRITGAGKNGATARGGRLRTAAGNQRGAVLDRMKRAPMAGTVGRGGKARSGQGAKGGKKPSGVSAIPRGELKRYRMLQNKIRPVRESLDRDGSTMVGSADRERTSRASARHRQNLRKLRRITNTMRRLSNSPETPNIPRLPVVASTGARLGRTAAIKRMDGPRRFGGQSFRDLRGQYTDGQVQYEDSYMNKLYKRKDKGSTVKGPKLGGVVRKGAAKPGTTPESLGTISRSRSQAKAAQRNRREQVLDRGRTGVTGLGRMRRNPRIRATDTGMRQLSLVGKPKKLKRYKPVK